MSWPQFELDKFLFMQTHSMQQPISQKLQMYGSNLQWKSFMSWPQFELDKFLFMQTHSS